MAAGILWPLEPNDHQLQAGQFSAEQLIQPSPIGYPQPFKEMFKEQMLPFSLGCARDIDSKYVY